MRGCISESGPGEGGNTRSKATCEWEGENVPFSPIFTNIPFLTIYLIMSLIASLLGEYSSTAEGMCGYGAAHVVWDVPTATLTVSSAEHGQ